MNLENKENVAQVKSTEKNIQKSQSDKVEKDVKTEIESYLAEGKRAMIGHDYQGALEPLSKCCHLICENFGEMDEMLADPSYQYGLCLFEVSREQSGVFGNEIQDKVCVPDSSNNELDPILEDEQPSKSKPEGTKNDAETSQKNDEGDDEEEEQADEDDSQLAYEWLEISRLLYSQKEGKEAKLREAETLSLLAELKTEMEQFGPAKEDYQAALLLQQKYLDQNDRAIATNYYQAGTVDLYLSMPSEAQESFEKAAKIIQNNLDDTKKKFASETDGSKIGKLKRLLDEYESILPEMKEKVQEAQSMVNELNTMKQTLSSTLKSAFGFSSSGAGSSSFPTNISGGPVNTLQVKRKAKPDSSEASKKPKN